LKYEAYTVLRLYLNENKEILSKLDSLYQSKHKGMIKRILEIINEYNRWLELKK
jgi:hemerythrin superfamily protein